MTLCYNVVKGSDDKVADLLGYTKLYGAQAAPHLVANLRARYDEANPNNHIDPYTKDIYSIAQKLYIHRENTIARTNLKAIEHSGSHLYSTYRGLKEAFSSYYNNPEEALHNRINMLSNIFSDVLDQCNYPNKSRQEIINGWRENGKPVAGEFAILDKVYNVILAELNEAFNEGTEEGKIRAEKYQQVLDNWGALVTFVRVKLRDTEGIKIGNKLEWAVDMDPLEFGDNNMQELFDRTEATRESWQETVDMRSCFGTIGKNVRRIISCCPEIETKEINGKTVRTIKKDDLGYTVMLDPVVVHQSLRTILRNIRSEEDMMKAFYTSKAELEQNGKTVVNSELLGTLKYEFLAPIVELLKTNSKLRTEFLVDMRRDFQPYSILTFNKKFTGKIKQYAVKILNRVAENALGGKYMARIMLGKAIDPKNSIYNKNGNVNWAKLQEFREGMQTWFVPKVVNVAKWYSPNVSFTERRNFLHNTLTMLNIDITTEGVETLMKDKERIKEVIKNLKEAYKYGINGNLSSTAITNLDNHRFTELSQKRSFTSILFATSKKSDKGVLLEKIDKILTTISSTTEVVRMENRVRHKNAKGKNISMYSDILPCAMGDFFTDIRRYVQYNDKEGLRAYITNKYLKSSYFKDSDGTILNTWIQELLDCCDSEEELSETFAAKFDYDRNLGTSDTVFENFTERFHIIDLLTRFYNDRQVSEKADTAYYPTFILGDSGKSKYIKAKVYSDEEVIEGLYKVYLQEKNRMKLQKAANEKMQKDGYKTISNFSQRKEGEYTMLPFLNNPKYSRIIKEGNKESVKEAIKAYLNDAVVDFKNELQEQNLLSTVQKKAEKVVNGTKTWVETDVYTSIPYNITPENIDKELLNYLGNYKLATINQLQLFAIDNAFYGTYNKDLDKVIGTAKDLQKRYKAYHSTGTELNIAALDDYGDKYSEDGYETALYVDDIKLSSLDTSPKFLDKVNTTLDKDNWTKYLKNNVTDGQGWRTLRSYRKVLGMAGKWTSEMENAFEEIENIKASYPKGQIPMEEKIKIANLAVVLQPIKPVMTTHEVYSINDTDSLLIPVFHKYSEAVIIPELLPEGSKLQDMAYYMEDNNIDLIAATSCVKTGNFGSVDIKGVKDAAALNSTLSKAYVHKLSYEGYRIQTNVPDHGYASRLFGTQSRKIIMSGLRMNGDYSHYIPSKYVNLGGKLGSVKMDKGRNLLTFYNALIVAQMIKSFDKFSEKIDSVEKLAEILMQAVINNDRNSIDQLLAYGIIDNDLAVPLYEPGLEHDSSSLLLSIFRKVVNKQTIMGSSMVQMSPMGLSSYDDGGDLSLITDDEGNVTGTECEIPWDLHYTIKHKDGSTEDIPLKFEDYCNEDGTLKLDDDGIALIEKKLPGSTSFIAYRIPTEAMYSMFCVKVKRFTNKMAGGTIKLPAECTTIAGFDFDIDKLFCMRREFIGRLRKSTEKNVDKLLSTFAGQRVEDVLELESYDYNRTPLENSRASINNTIIDIMEKRLQDEETFANRYTPGGFPQASNAARTLRELLYGDLSSIKSNGKIDKAALSERASKQEFDPEPEYDPSDPIALLRYNQQNQIAGKLIGVFANHNTNHIFAKAMEQMKLSDPIAFAGHSYSDLLNAPKGINVDVNLAELLAASVDAVKDPVLNFLNFNTLTADSAAFLVRLGYTTEEIGLLLNQPIIKEICDYAFNNDISLDVAVRDKRAAYFKAAGLKEFDEIILDEQEYLNNLSTQSMMDNIAKHREEKESGKKPMEDVAFLKKQLLFLDLFTNIQNSAAELSQFVKATKFTAANSVGSTLGDLLAQQVQVFDYINADPKSKRIQMRLYKDVFYPINMNEDIYDMNDEQWYASLLDNPFAYEQLMFDANRKALKSFSKYYPYLNSSYVKVRNLVNGLIKYGTIDADLINTLHKDMIVYWLAQQETSDFNKHLIRFDSVWSDMDGNKPPLWFYYTHIFAKDLFLELDKNPELKNMPIFNYMEPNYDRQTASLTLQIQSVGGLHQHQKDAITNSWAELYKKYPQIARDLFLYNYYVAGFDFTHRTFMHLAPTELKESIKVPSETNPDRSYVDFLKEILENKEFGIDARSFIIDFIRNHPDNKKLVFNISKSKTATEILDKIAKDDLGNLEESFEIDTSKEDYSIFIQQQDKVSGATKFTPALLYNGYLYIADSPMDAFNLSSSTKMVYKRYTLLTALGYKGYSSSDFNNKEYDYTEDTFQRSDVEEVDISDSEVLAEQTPEQTPEDEYDYITITLRNGRKIRRRKQFPRQYYNRKTGASDFSEGTSEGNIELIPETILSTKEKLNIIDEIAREFAITYWDIEKRDPTTTAEEKTSFDQFYEQMKERLLKGSEDQLQELVERVRKSCRDRGIMLLDENGLPKIGC